MAAPPSARPRIVIIGAGFGGLACAKALGGANATVTVVDRRNYHLFVPLLYQVATAALSPADIARPIRSILSRYRNIEVVLGDVAGIDLDARRVILHDGPDLTSTGSCSRPAPTTTISATTPGPRRRRGRARSRTPAPSAAGCCSPSSGRRSPPTPPSRRALLTTVVVGGGPTGVEMAGSVAELARHALVRDFRRIDPSKAQIILVEAGPRLLSTFPESLSDYARTAMERLGVTVRTGARVEAIAEDAVNIDGRDRSRPAPSSGAPASAPRPPPPISACRSTAPAASPSAPTSPFPAMTALYVIGDSAAAPDADGNPLPALAQVAHQQGWHLGRSLRRNIERGTPLPPFRYHSRGDTAIIGRNAAVFDFGRLRLKGRIGWMLWALVHIYLLTGFENRSLVAVHWFWMYLTYQRGARLITDDAEPDH